MFKSQQRFRSERDDLLTEKINKIELNTNDEKRLQSIDCKWNVKT